MSCPNVVSAGAFVGAGSLMTTQRYSDQQVPSNSKYIKVFCFKKLVVPEPAQFHPHHPRSIISQDDIHSYQVPLWPEYDLFLYGLRSFFERQVSINLPPLVCISHIG